MNYRRNSFTSAPTLGNWPNRYDHPGRFPNFDQDSMVPPSGFLRSLSLRNDSIIHSGLFDPLGVYEDRVFPGNFRSAGLPRRPPPPWRILQTPRQATPTYPQVFLPQQTTPEHNLRLSQDDQNKVMTKLEKKIYNPAPKNPTKRMSFRDQNRGGPYDSNAKDLDDEDGKGCVVCLEDFEPKEAVMVTPCKHTFHKECIVRWLKSNGKCPVCRFVIYKKAGEASTPEVNLGRVVTDDLSASVMQVVEEDFIF